MLVWRSREVHSRKISLHEKNYFVYIGALFIYWVDSCLYFHLFFSKPIKDIIEAAKRIRQGDFKSRARIYYKDEIGSLGLAFNLMAEGLESYRKEVETKENQCGSLIDKLMTAQEEERKSISRELHDQLSQSLSALLLKVNSLGHKNRIKENPKEASLYSELEDQIRGIIDDVRRLAWSMRPSILDDYGLDSALARYVEEMRKQYRVTIDYQYEAPLSNRLPSNIEVSLYRITLEALKNALRHSKATQISIVLIRQIEDITLVIEDNGIGMKIDNGSVASSSGGLGLIGMRERATLIGGSFIIESLSLKGTAIQVRIPLI